MDSNTELNLSNLHESATAYSESRRQRVAIIAILSVLTLERLAYYALSSSFFLFLNVSPWNTIGSWDSLSALNAVFILTGITYLSALLGGYISDAFFGRFKTIICGFIVYILGFLLLTLLAGGQLPSCRSQDGSKGHESCRAYVYFSICVIGIGAGTVKSNIAPFGAEQIRSANPQKLRSFFNWFYWCINLGSLIGIGAIAYIEQDSPGICTNGFFCGYLIATCCLLLALLLFICGCRWYYLAPVQGSLLVDVFRIIFEALRNTFHHFKLRRQNSEIAYSPLHLEPSCLDRAKIRYGGSFHEMAVDDVRSLGRILSIFAALIPYWMVCFQMETSFQVQGLHMRFSEIIGQINNTNETSFDTGRLENFEGKDDGSQINFLVDVETFNVPAAWLTLFNQIFLLISIPLLTVWVYPRMDRAGIRLSLLFRIGLGMAFATLAVMMAGGLESYRTYLWRNDNSSHIDEVVGNVTYHAVDMSIFWQIPQYVMIGAAEVFANIAGLQLAFTSAPPSFQGLIMGLFYALEGVASFLGFFLLQLVSPFWFKSSIDYGDINENYLDYFLYFLGVIQFTTLVGFAIALYVRRFSLHLVAMPTMSASLPRRDVVNNRDQAADSSSEGESDEEGIIRGNIGTFTRDTQVLI